MSFLSNSQPNYGFNLNKAVSSLLKKSNEAKGHEFTLESLSHQTFKNHPQYSIGCSMLSLQIDLGPENSTVFHLYGGQNIYRINSTTREQM